MQIFDLICDFFRNSLLTSQYDYFFYMESDAIPVRKLWMDRIYEEVEFVSEFWVKGSIYRGKSKPLEYCYTLCGCAEHMNGNSFYKLGDPNFNSFLNKLEKNINFDR